MPLPRPLRPVVVARAAGALVVAGGALLAVASCAGEPTAVPANRAPEATIVAPAAGATFRAGDTIAYSGSGADPEDGEVAASRMAWWVERVRGSEVRTVVPRTAGARAGTIVVPTRGELWPEMRYRLFLEVRDRGGLADTVLRELAARTAVLRLATVPAGLQVALDGTAAGNRDVPVVVGAQHDVNVATPQPLGGAQYEFTGWSSGAARAHTLTIPPEGATLTATFRLIPPPNVPPTVAVTMPQNGTTITLGTPLLLLATAADADGRVVRVEFLQGTTVVGSAAGAPWQAGWYPTAVGTYNVTARAIDDSAAVTTSAPVTVNVVHPPNRAPTVALSSPVNGSNVTVNAPLTLRASASDADGRVTRVEFLVGSTVLGVATTSPFELTWTPVALGSVALAARATDDSGAVVTSAPVTVNVVAAPNVAPTVALVSPASGSSWLVGTPVTLRATASDADGTIARVAFYANGQPMGDDTTAPYELAWSPILPVSYQLTARATDDDGAITESAPVTVTGLRPNQAPVATITAPVEGTRFRAGETITYAGTGSDAEEGTIPPARMTWWVDLHHDTHTHPFVAPTTGSAGGTVLLPTVTEVSPNIWYRFHLAVRDTGGLADTVTRDIVPVTATMRFETVPAGLQVTVDGQPRTTPVDIVGVVGTQRVLGAPSPQTLGATQYVFQGWSDGGAASHPIATPAQNTTWVATFTAVAPANQPPTVAVTAPSAGATLTAGTPVTLRANATDSDGTVAQVVFFVDGVQVGTDAASPFEVPWTPSALGAHQVTARATDDDGDFTLSAAVGFTVQAAGGGDVTAPTVQVTSPATNTSGLTGAVVVQASASDDIGVAGVTFQIDGEPIGAEDTSAPYSVTIPATSAFTTGQHVIRARARDAAGNLSPWSTVTVGFGGAVDLPAGFTRTMFVNGLAPVSMMNFAPDGRLFVSEKDGRLRVVKNGALLATPFHTFQVQTDGERGLLGVAFDPAFSTTRWVYVYYTATNPTRNILVRLRASTANPDAADASQIDTLFQVPNLGATNHNGGALHFGPDGKLYLAVGDHFEGNSQSLTTLHGKILRLNADGSIPTDNPFYGQTTLGNRAIWARGLRNPFTFGFQPGTGRMLINDVGEGSWEEINEGVAGANYGWPNSEGPTTNPAFRSPVYAYPHGGAITTGFAIVGAAFYNPSTTTFPSSYVGNYFFGDYVGSWVARMDPANGNAVYAFARFGGAYVFDVRAGPDGALYVLAERVNGSYGIWRIQRTP